VRQQFWPFCFHAPSPQQLRVTRCTSSKIYSHWMWGTKWTQKCVHKGCLLYFTQTSLYVVLLCESRAF